MTSIQNPTHPTEIYVDDFGKRPKCAAHLDYENATPAIFVNPDAKCSDCEWIGGSK